MRALERPPRQPVVKVSECSERSPIDRRATSAARARSIFAMLGMAIGARLGRHLLGSMKALAGPNPRSERLMRVAGETLVV